MFVKVFMPDCFFMLWYIIWLLEVVGWVTGFIEINRSTI